MDLNNFVYHFLFNGTYILMMVRKQKKKTTLQQQKDSPQTKLFSFFFFLLPILQFYCTAFHGNCWSIYLRYKWNIPLDSWMFPACQPRNQTLHDITEIHHFFPLAKWLSGEIVVVSCTFLFWSSCHFLIRLIKRCVFCQGKYIDTSLLLTAKDSHKKFHQGKILHYSLCLAKKKINLIPQNNFIYRNNYTDFKENICTVSSLTIWGF